MLIILKKIIAFKIKTGYHLELLTAETMELLESTENEIIEDKISENAFHLEIMEVILVSCKIVNNDCKQDSTICIHLFKYIIGTIVGNFTNKFYIFDKI